MKLTKPQYILYFMQIASRSAGCLTSTDRIALLQAAKADGVFKDKRAFSNALHQLAKDKHIVKEGKVWYMTDSGYDYIAKIWQNFNASHEGEDAALDEEVETETDALCNEIKKLQESVQSLKSERDAVNGDNAKLKAQLEILNNENENLKRDNESCVKQIDAIVADCVQLRKMYNDAIAECNRLNRLLDSRSTYADEAAMWADVAQRFANVARSFQR